MKQVSIDRWAGGSETAIATVLTREERNKLWVELYERGYSTIEIAKQYGVDRGTVKWVLKKHGVKMRNSGIRKKYELNEKAFDNLNDEETLYWLGFLMADGYVDGKRHRVVLSLAVKDRVHIEKFKRFMGYTGKIYEERTKPYVLSNGVIVKERRKVVLHIYSHRIVGRLEELGFTKERKNEYPEWVEKLSDNLFKHWLRGLIDGDGWVTILREGKNIRFVVGLCGYPGLVKAVAERVERIFGIKVNVRVSSGSNKIVEFKVRDGKGMMIADWLYRDARVYLDRKYEKYLEYKRYLEVKSGGGINGDVDKSA